MTYELTPADRDALSDAGTLTNPIEGFTTQELMAELCKREGTETYKVKECQRYAIVIGGSRWVGEGEARVLVVKE